MHMCSMVGFFIAFISCMSGKSKKGLAERDTGPEVVEIACQARLEVLSQMHRTENLFSQQKYSFN